MPNGRGVTINDANAPLKRQVRLPPAERRARLLVVAEAVIARDGAAASMASIAAEAGVAKALLYRYFTGKAELYAVLVSAAIVDIKQVLAVSLRGEQSTRTRHELAIEGFLQQLEAHRAAFTLLTRAPGGDELAANRLISEFVQELGDELAGLIAADYGLANNPDAEALALTWAHALVGMVLSAARLWVDRDHVSRNVLAVQLTDLIWGRYADLATAFDERRRSDPALRPAPLVP